VNRGEGRGSEVVWRNGDEKLRFFSAPCKVVLVVVSALIVGPAPGREGDGSDRSPKKLLPAARWVRWVDRWVGT